MNNIQLFTAKIYKYGTDILLEECQVMSLSLFQAIHTLSEYVFGEDSHFQHPVEIRSIERMTNVNNIINPEFVFEEMDNEENGGEHNHYTGDIPLNIAKNMTENQTITFKCECHEELRIPAQMGFPFVTCPNCQLEIKPTEIKNAGGIYYYEKEKGRK